MAHKKSFKELLWFSLGRLTRQPSVDVFASGCAMFDRSLEEPITHLGRDWGVVAEEDAHSVNLHFRLIWSYDP